MTDIDLSAHLKGFKEGLEHYDRLREEALANGDTAAAKKYEDAIRGCRKGIEKYIDGYLKDG